MGHAKYKPYFSSNPRVTSKILGSLYHTVHAYSRVLLARMAVSPDALYAAGQTLGLCAILNLAHPRQTPKMTRTNAPPKRSLPGFEQSDYVIVGGGTAGLVLAARLSEDPTIQVAVIEAGKSRLGDENVESPAGMHHLLHNPEYDWVYESTPQVWCPDLQKKKNPDRRAPVD